MKNPIRARGLVAVGIVMTIGAGCAIAIVVLESIYLAQASALMFYTLFKRVS